MATIRTRRKEQETGRRHVIVALILLVWMSAIIWRLVHLQVNRHEELSQRAAGQRQQEVKLAPPRGEIVDRKGNILAQSVMGSTVHADPKMIRASKQSVEWIASLLADALGEKDHKELQAELSRDDRNFVRLRRRLDPEKAAAVARTIEANKIVGVGLQDEPIRVYPNRSLASHVIGFVNADEEGQDGLELVKEKFLKGSGGTVVFENDALGHAFDRQDEPVRVGARIVTTIDIGLQHQVEAYLQTAWRETHSKSASAVVLDLHTGEILSLATFPNFDPNIRPSKTQPAAREAEMAMRRNRVITDYYEPGSVFKIVTYSAALEEGLIRPNEKINCLNGRIELFGRVIGDHVSGWLTASDALAKSSNVGAIQLALKVTRKFGDDRLVDYMKAYGFGARTKIDLPGEIPGIVHAANRWSKTSIGSIAIGQEVGVTVIQMVAAMAAIGNGGVWIQPHVVKEIVGPDNQLIYSPEPETRRVISAKTAHELAGMLEQVVVSGTARHAVKLTGYTAAGKTGTPQKVDPVTKRYSNTKFMPTFAGFVPATNPRFAIIVMLDEPIGLHQGGQVSAPVFTRIAEAALLDYGVSPDSPEFQESLGVLTATLRNQLDHTAQVQAASLEAAAETLDRRQIPGVEEATNGKDARRNGARTETASTVSMNVVEGSFSGAVPVREIEPGVMPDFRGRSAGEVAKICRRLDLRANLVGKGLASRQIPAAGSRVQPGDSCRVEFH
ncbi:MAG: penicillin-binding protein [Acidobacteriota bacterium]